MHKILWLLLLIGVCACDNKMKQPRGHSHPVATKTNAHKVKVVIKDGTHSAAVSYYNPQTNYRANYQVKVEVNNGQVRKINFPEDSYLNEIEINPEQLDETGTVKLHDAEQREFGVEIVD